MLYMEGFALTGDVSKVVTESRSCIVKTDFSVILGFQIFSLSIFGERLINS